MRRVAVLGDIHGNIDAFKAVLKDISSQSIDELLITGDIVGYYYHADEVLDSLKNWKYEIIQGNHDRTLNKFCNWSNEIKENYRKKYGSALEIASKTLSNNEINYLKNLPVKKKLHINSYIVTLCHGSPYNQDEYIYPDASIDILKKCANCQSNIVIMGHTHYPMIKVIDNTILLNPGSVGQLRNGQSGASWAILNFDDLNIKFRIVSYNVEKLISEINKKDFNIPYLINILKKK